MQSFARMIYLLYAAFFLASGVSGVLFAHIEFTGWFGVSVTPPEAATDLLDQYRFMRAVEAGFGLLALTVRGRFFTDSDIRGALLIAFLLIPVARTVSMGIDGMPSPPFVTLTVLEYALCAFLAWASRDATPRGPGQPG